MRVEAVSRRGIVVGQPVEMVAFVGGEAKRSGEASEYVFGRLRAARLLQAGVVVGGHASEHCDFFPPQPRGTSAWPGGDANVFRTQGTPSVPEEIGKLYTIHVFRVGPALPRRQL